MSIVNNIKEFFLNFKTESIDEKIIVSKYASTINDFDKQISNDEYTNTIEENILIIYGYTFRLEDVNQRLFYTFSEAVNAINMDNLMRNEDGVKLNSYVYIRVIKYILDEINGQVNEEYKKKAINTHKDLEAKKAKENKYHVYQY